MILGTFLLPWHPGKQSTCFLRIEAGQARQFSGGSLVNHPQENFSRPRSKSPILL